MDETNILLLAVYGCVLTILFVCTALACKMQTTRTSVSTEYITL